MGKFLYWVGGVINWLAYIWLVTSEAFEEIGYATIGDSLRGIVSAAETREQFFRAERRRPSYQSAAAKVAHTP